MRIKSRRLWCLYIGAGVLMAIVQYAEGTITYEFYRLNDLNPGGTPVWEISGGYYKVYKVGLHTPSDIVLKSAGTPCGKPAHKPGGADYPGHFHVNRSNDSSNPWVSALPPKYADGEKYETKKYYEVRILNNGSDANNDPSQNHTQGLDDGQDADSQSGDPDFRYNCYGYAFDKTGLDNWKDVLLHDGSTGAGKVVSSAAGLYSEDYTDVQNSSDHWVMYMTGHANYISYISTNHCEIRKLKFKYGASQIFEFEYDAPGRDPDAYFFGCSDCGTPKYYEKE